MFIPNLPCDLRKNGPVNVYGRSVVGPAIAERCAIVKIKHQSQDTTKRGDSGASRSHADEFVNENRILLAATTKTMIDDQLTVIGYKIRVKMMHPRYGVTGTLDHWEVEGEIWA